jgi:hypothetical protein
LVALLAVAVFAFEAVLVADAFLAGEALMLALTAAAPPLLAEVDLVGEAGFASDLLREPLRAVVEAFDFEAALGAGLLSASELVAVLRAWRT